MQEIVEKSCPIKLSFGMESSSTLWNIVFEGFDQDMVLISKFEGNDPKAINLLNRFGEILGEKYSDCIVETSASGLLIKKLFHENDLSKISQWSELMNSLQEQILILIRKNTR
ncbi:hypothetical protein MYX76_00130 [Desulfobacterota bacterium AH_259_B03_O07]|nr:hypothetical protein [Desulfobacterota bacterium AH_259_B03_O07]